MLTKQYMRTVLERIVDFTDIDHQLFCANGYDGVIAILGALRGVEFPCVVIEERDSGYFQVVEGALDRYSQSVWIMGQVARDEDQDARSEMNDSMYVLMKRIVSIIILDATDGLLPGVDLSRVSYYSRMGGPKCVGYELNISFNDNISLL